MTQPKIAVCTTFPLDYPTYREMLATFDHFWPKEVELYIDLDETSDDVLKQKQEEFNALMPSGRQFYINHKRSEAKAKFLQTHDEDSPNVPYRFHVCRFSHKVFALYGVLPEMDRFDFLIWLDADVITHATPDFEEILPKDEEDVSYLGRSDAPHSECSFVAYNLGFGGENIIKEMYEYYVTDKVLTLPGWTDCDVFDAVLSEGCFKGNNLSEGIKGWHVFPESPLGKYMNHLKGKRKHQEKRALLDANNMQIKTKNCIPNEQILKHIEINTPLIKHWVDYVRPMGDEVVIASAGPSLSKSDIQPYVDRGVKIVAVKHAIDRLKQWEIKPWACVLLDPRGHVEKFVEEADTDVIYFVASMVDPSVVKALLDQGCIVVGYHAFVGAGEHKKLPKGTLMVSGGSGTATRCIGLLHECFGFDQFECFGYDLCYHEKPDFTETIEDGRPKYIEVTLAAKTWGNKQVKRTFWTEGQFLAQAKELHDLYKEEKRFTIRLHGHGLGAWQQEHFIDLKRWADDQNERIDKRKESAQTLEEWENGIRAGRS